MISEDFTNVFGGEEFLVCGWTTTCGVGVGGGESTTVGVAFGL